jgi:PEGA domain
MNASHPLCPYCLELIRKEIIVLVLAVVLCSSGCATIFHGSNQNVTLESEPSGANVRVGPYKGITPYTISMPKGKDYPIEYSKDEYQSASTALQKSFDGIGALNILFFPGFIIDLATGAMFRYDPDRYHETLMPVSSPRR